VIARGISMKTSNPKVKNTTTLPPNYSSPVRMQPRILRLIFMKLAQIKTLNEEMAKNIPKLQVHVPVDRTIKNYICMK
jgi:hypothetical protein